MIGSRSIAGGFTLIELLVVTTIMTMLFPLLLPALGKEMESSRTSRCMSIIRSLTQMMAIHTADSREAIPRVKTVTTFSSIAGSPASSSMMGPMRPYKFDH